MDRQLSRLPLSPALIFHSCTLHTLRCDPPARFCADGSSDSLSCLAFTRLVPLFRMFRDWKSLHILPERSEKERRSSPAAFEVAPSCIVARARTAVVLIELQAATSLAYAGPPHRQLIAQSA